METFHLPFGDVDGDSAIIDGDTVQRQRTFLLITNFSVLAASPQGRGPEEC